MASHFTKRTGMVAALALGLAGVPAAAVAQSAAGTGIDSDLVRPGAGASTAPAPVAAPVAGGGYADPMGEPRYTSAPAPAAPAPATPQPLASNCGARAGGTYHQDDVISAAESVFGKGARGLAAMIRDILAKQGEPNAYIAGREAGGAIAIGLRYGSGTLCRAGLAPSPVYWTGPSIGFDFGASGAKTFVLIYNLYRPEDLYHRFIAGEGQAYLVGGFNVSYLRYGNVVLIPVRMGVGLRLGVNGGYMKITKNLNYLPF